jgi:hypothetical protein
MPSQPVGSVIRAAPVYPKIITVSVLQRCSCAASVCPNTVVSLTDFLFSCYFPHFLSSELCSHWLTKNKRCLWLVGQISQRQVVWFFNGNRRCNTKILGRWEILLIQPVGMAPKSTVLKTFMLLSWCCPLGQGKEHLAAREFIIMDRLIPILTPLSSRWTVPFGASAIFLKAQTCH